MYHHKRGTKRKSKEPYQVPQRSTVRAIKAQTERNQIRKGVMPVAHHQERKL